MSVPHLGATLDETSRLAAIVMSASDGIIGKTLEGIIATWNRSAERIFGYSADEAIGQHISLVIPEGHRDEASAALARVRAGERIEAFESRRVRKDGRLIDVRLTLSPVWDASGAVIGASKIVTDISGLGSSERQLSQLLETAPDAMMIAEADGRIWLVNSQAELMFGYPADDLTGKPVELLMPERFRTAHLRHRNGYLTDPRVRPMGAGLELYGLRRDGSEFPIELSLSPLETESGVLVSTAIRDITERKQVEQLLRDSLEEKEMLLKEVHHRVKNNLAVVGSLFYLQAAHMTDPEMVELMRDSQDRVRSMAMVHESLYNSSSLADVDFAEYARKLCQQLISNYSIGGRISLQTHLDPVLLSIDVAVPCGLILNELVTNTIKHAFPDNSAGCVTLRLTHHDGTVRVEVRDDGVGIPADFDLDAGTSLGLRLIRSLSRQIDGSVDVVDAAPGALATLVFPLDRHEDEA